MVPYSQADCPYPLNWDPQAAPGASDMCVAPCPNLFYSSGEWVAIRVVAYVFSFISLVINLFLCITFFRFCRDPFLLIVLVNVVFAA